jgi:pimeloyl-ACP methyl ester carboxylesterase
VSASPRPHRAYIDCAGRQIHFCTLGEGRPLLLVHQNAYSGEMWTALMPHLVARGYRTIAPDLPGYGCSDALTGEPSLNDYVASTIAVLDELRVDEFDVVGQHLGAWVALRAAVEHPDRVGSAIGYGLYLPGGPRESFITAAAPPVYDREGTTLVRHWEARWQFGGPAFTAAMAVRSLAADLQAGERRHLGLLAMRDEDHAVTLQALRRPYLAISSPRDTFYEESQRAARLSEHVTFFDAGESNSVSFADENPGRYAQIIDEFLRGERLTPI